MAVIAKQRYKLDIAPKGGWVVVYASQHDDGAREIEFEITNQGNAYSIPASINVSVQGIKSNKSYFSHSCSYSGNIVTMALADDMTDIIGKSICVLKFTNSSQQKLATAKFVLNVDTDSSSEGIIIDTEAEEIFNQMLNEIRAQASAISADIAGLQSMVGTPLVASAASAMTDHNKIYVYTGSESGYTNGNWYYWNGSTWTSGGVYNSTAFETDATLSKSGNAADAKAVGLQYNDLFEIGNISINNSGWSYDTNWARVRTKKDTTIKLKAGQKIGLTDYTTARFYVGGETLDGEYVNTGWIRTDYSAEKDGEYVVLIDTYPSYTDQTTVDGLASLFFAPISALIYYIKSVSGIVYNSIQYAVETHSGYFSVNGGITPASDISKEVYTEKIPVSAGDVLTVRLQYLTRRAIWASYVLYDANGYFIGRTVFANLNNTDITENITITNQSAKYIAFSYRTYNEVQFVLYGQKLAGYTQRNLSRIAQNITAEIVNRNVKSINHRGFNSVAPENTLPAFRFSRKNGFAIVETDVSFTSDGVAVLLHDNTINRTARNADGSAISSTISISDITYEQALTYDFGIWKNPEYAGTKIPTLIEFLILCKNIGLHPYIELKSNGATEERIAGLVDIVKSVGMIGVVTWISSADTLLSYIKASDSKARLGYIVGEVSATSITSALGLKMDDNDVFIDSASYTQEEINMCKDANLPMEVWTIDSPTGIKNLDPYISGVTSNNLCAGIVLYNSAME